MNKYFIIAAKYNKAMVEHILDIVPDITVVQDINEATHIVYPTGSTILSIPKQYYDYPRISAADLIVNNAKKEELDDKQVDEIAKMLGSTSKDSFVLGCKMYYKIPVDKIKKITVDVLSNAQDIKSTEEYQFLIEEIAHVTASKV